MSKPPKDVTSSYVSDKKEQVVKALLVFNARPLRDYYEPAFGYNAIKAAIEVFLSYLLFAGLRKNTGMCDSLTDFAYQHYLDLVENGQTGSILDGTTGEVIGGGWFEHYMEVLDVLERFYREDMLSALHALQQDYSVAHLRLHRITHFLLVVEATGFYLLPPPQGVSDHAW
jgi:hypothetical protein